MDKTQGSSTRCNSTILTYLARVHLFFSLQLKKKKDVFCVFNTRICLGWKSYVFFVFKLQSIGQGLVQTVDLGRDAEVDGSVTDFDDEAANDIGVDLIQFSYGFERM